MFVKVSKIMYFLICGSIRIHIGPILSTPMRYSLTSNQQQQGCHILKSAVANCGHSAVFIDPQLQSLKGHETTERLFSVCTLAVEIDPTGKSQPKLFLNGRVIVFT